MEDQFMQDVNHTHAQTLNLPALPKNVYNFSTIGCKNKMQLVLVMQQIWPHHWFTATTMCHKNHITPNLACMAIALPRFRLRERIKMSMRFPQFPSPCLTRVLSLERINLPWINWTVHVCSFGFHLQLRKVVKVHWLSFITSYFYKWEIRSPSGLSLSSKNHPCVHPCPTSSIDPQSDLLPRLDLGFFSKYLLETKQGSENTHRAPMNGENRPLVTDEPVEFEN